MARRRIEGVLFAAIVLVVAGAFLCRHGSRSSEAARESTSGTEELQLRAERSSTGREDPVLAKIQPGLDLVSPTSQMLTILPSAASDFGALEAKVVELGGRVLSRLGLKDGVPRLRIQLPGASIVKLAEVTEVGWIERHVRRRFLNDVAVSNTLMNVETARIEHGLTGLGQVITTSDSGIDTGDLETMHADLRPNLIGFAKTHEGEFTYTFDEKEYTAEISPTDISGHGTHTAGSLVGTGAMSEGRFKGVAYEAKLWAWFCGGVDGYVYTPEEFADTFRPNALGTTNAYIHSASWGGDTNIYSTESQSIDSWCWSHPDFLPVFAAGNDGKNNAICAEGAAKNVLCVGATESYRTNKGSYANNPDELAYFSSHGPMPDGRIKPDICAPGTYVVSTRSSQAAKYSWGVYGANTNYAYNSGTSMATPLTAGTVALIRQWLVEQGGFTNQAPSAALMKAIITGGATRLGSSFPNKDFGWGRVNLADSLFPSNGLGVVLKDYIPFSRSSVESFEITLTNAAPLDVQLCWVDYPADPATAETKSLVIDLDLVVSNRQTGVTYSADDHVNNLEGVRLDVAEPGVYTVFVRGPSSGFLSSTQGGAAAVYVRGAVGPNEYVTVTVAAEGGADHNCSPAVGSYQFVKGTVVTFSAGKYAGDDGADYRYSSYWGLDLERYPLLGWTADGATPVEGTNSVVELILTNDVSLTWRWQETPGDVALWLESCDDFNGRLMYPNYPNYGIGYWIPYGMEQTLTAEDSPLLAVCSSPDGGMTVPVNGYVYVNSNGRLRPSSFGTLRFTSFRVMDEAENTVFGWDETNHYRLVDSVTLPMTAFTAVTFGYADEKSQNATVALPYWWWARNFWGAYSNGAIDVEKTYSTGDPDGDGFPNLAEYAEPTDPWDADSFPFRFTDFSPTGLTYVAGLTSSVRLQYTPKLGGAWSNLVTETTSPMSVTNHIDFTTPSMASGFYRLVR